ncbi:WhiB family transcriptional regulator [Mycobacterium sp. NPDC003449]
MNQHLPCASDPDLFFGAHTDQSGPSVEMKQRAAHLSKVARTRCIRECPLAQQKLCAQTALDTNATYGVWAGVQLPGVQTRKIPQLNAAREILQGIVDGSIDPSTHPSNRELFRGSQLALLAPRIGPDARQLSIAGAASTAVSA